MSKSDEALEKLRGSVLRYENPCDPIDPENGEFLVTIPDEILKQAGLKIGDPVDVTEERGKIIIQASKKD